MTGRFEEAENDRAPLVDAHHASSKQIGEYKSILGSHCRYQKLSGPLSSQVSRADRRDVPDQTSSSERPSAKNRTSHSEPAQVSFCILERRELFFDQAALRV